MSSETDPVRILAIDGGGVRGVIPARFLAELERRTNKPVSELFDLVTGTSTGGLLALSLTVPRSRDGYLHSSHELVKLYQLHAGRIFPPNVLRKLKLRKASHNPLQSVVREYLGGSMLSAAVTDVMVPAYEIERRQPFFFKSWRACEDSAWDFQASDAALATCSAPTIFDPWPVVPRHGNRTYTLMDGGIFANNPALCAVIEVRKRQPTRPIVVLSLGTGDLEETVSEEKAKAWNILDWGRKGFGIVSDAISDAIEYQLDHLHGVTQIRWNTELSASSESLDNSNPANIDLLISFAEERIRIKDREIQSVADGLLRSPHQS